MFCAAARRLDVVRVSDFHFDLPAELIAQHPPAVRGASRMLVLDRTTGQISDERFADLPARLQPGDLLVLNDSRVLPARLFATRAGLATQANSPQPSGVIEVLLTEQVEGAGPGENVWRGLVKPAKKVRVGERLEFRERDSASRGPGLKPLAIEGDSRGLKPAANPKGPPSGVFQHSPGPAANPMLTAEVVGAGEYGERTLRFAGVEDFYGTLERIGHMPLPPYIQRDQAAEADTAEDRERYQTVYSHQAGSAAAPTAGLHFTPDVLAALTARGVEIVYLTLHVGLGTFQPVRVSELKDIRLHAERYTLPAATAEALNRALAEGRRIVAVGTTTTRTLEHIAVEAEKHIAGAKAQASLAAVVPGLKSRPIRLGRYCWSLRGIRDRRRCLSHRGTRFGLFRGC